MPARTIHHGDGIAWLRANPLDATHAIVTSLPDVSEIGRPLVEWRAWFVDTAELVCSSIADDAVAIFYQTDIKHDGAWIDKAHLVSTGADRAGVQCLFHRIACRAPAGTKTFGRPSYGHLLGFSRTLRVATGAGDVDVMPELGEMPWPRAIGTAVCHAICRWVLAHTQCRTIVDPFCGLGTVLAVANLHELDAIGVELSRKRAEKARALAL